MTRGKKGKNKERREERERDRSKEEKSLIGDESGRE
jgi:hypothetical protein